MCSIHQRNTIQEISVKEQRDISCKINSGVGLYIHLLLIQSIDSSTNKRQGVIKILKLPLWWNSNKIFNCCVLKVHMVDSSLIRYQGLPKEPFTTWSFRCFFPPENFQKITHLKLHHACNKSIKTLQLVLFDTHKASSLIFIHPKYLIKSILSCSLQPDF